MHFCPPPPPPVLVGHEQVLGLDVGVAGGHEVKDPRLGVARAKVLGLEVGHSRGVGVQVACV